MTILLECTYVYDHPYLNTGIQRVVRNIIDKLENTRGKNKCIPVVLKNGKVYEVKQLAPTEDKGQLSRARAWLDRGRNRYWVRHASIDQLALFQKSHTMRRILHVLFKFMSLWYLLPTAGTVLISRHMIDKERIVEIKVKPTDTLVLLDSSWHSNCGPLVESLKAQGVGIVAVIYDLIPLTHSQYCDAGLAKVFDQWFTWVSHTADGFLAISKTIRDEVEEFVAERLGEEEAATRWYDYFYLGSELDKAKSDGVVRAPVEALFEDRESVYIMVSTIEPRKNHAYLLDAFELLWEQGSEVTLFFVGCIGWNCQSVVDRVQNHPMLNKRLFMFNDLNDTELEYSYQRARSLLFSSYAEGFGLPLVEALQRQLPVMASDIGVFKEICGEFAAYFDLESPESLRDLVDQFERENVFPAKIPTGGWEWITWQGAADQFIKPILSPPVPKLKKAG